MDEDAPASRPWFDSLDGRIRFWATPLTFRCDVQLSSTASRKESICPVVASGGHPGPGPGA